MQLTKNASYLFTARIINAMSIMAITLIISRLLGPFVFGGYSFLNAVIMTSIVIANFGLDTLMVREVSRYPSLGSKYLSSVLGIKLIISMIVMAGLYGLFSLLLPDNILVGLLALFSTVILFNSLSQSFWHFGDAFQHFQPHATLWAFSNIVKIPFLLIFISFSKSLSAVIYSLVIAEFVSFSLSVTWIYKSYGIILKDFSLKFISRLSIKVLPMAAIFIVSALFFRIDQIMLGIMKDEGDVGIYSAAYKLIEFLSVIPGTVCIVALPGLSACYSTNIDKFKSNSFRTLFILGAAGLFIGLFLFFFSKPLILILYGSMFVKSINCLRVLSCAVIFIFINAYLSYIIIAMDKEKILALISSLATCLNILLNYYLISRYSYMGASFATLISEISLFIFCLYYFNKLNLLQFSS